MAKALFGHVGLSNDVRLADEVRRLRRQVGQLESDLARVSAAHDALVASITVDDDLRLLVLEGSPALT